MMLVALAEFVNNAFVNRVQLTPRIAMLLVLSKNFNCVGSKRLNTKSLFSLTSFSFCLIKKKQKIKNKRFLRSSLHFYECLSARLKLAPRPSKKLKFTAKLHRVCSILTRSFTIKLFIQSKRVCKSKKFEPFLNEVEGCLSKCSALFDKLRMTCALRLSASSPNPCVSFRTE